MLSRNQYCRRASWIGIEEARKERESFGRGGCQRGRENCLESLFALLHFNRADLSSSRSLENLMLDAAAELEILLKLAVPAAVDAVEAIHGRKAYLRY